ncbi:1-acylglycerol-3-phosphate O-acyltransferase [Kappamyces sp. JEL0829]|nr:1-acylglycerol-3-phosphate O-acyltransferase [Kappamyces sp. JEL0829]
MNYIVLSLFFVLFRVVFSRSGKVRFVVRAVMLALGIGISSLTTIVASPFLYLLGKGPHINNVLAWTFAKVGPLLTGVQCNVIEGLEHIQEHTTPVVYVANHQSTLDMCFMAFCFPPRTVITAKREVKFIPFMGQVMQAGNNIFIDRFVAAAHARGNRASAVEAMNRVGERMKRDNVSVWVFPEGTRSHQRTKTLLPFKKGAFHLARQGGFPIVPIVASTYFPIYDEKSMKFENGTIQVKALAPIKSDDPNQSLDELIAATRDAMQAALSSLDSVPSAKALKSE